MLEQNISSVNISRNNTIEIIKVSYKVLLVSSSLLNIQPALSQIVINKNISHEPLIIEGISGGSIAALDIAKTKHTATGYCDGFASLQPNHILNIESLFQSLRLEVKSNVDTTIMVRGPGGIWCNDDTHNANPMIQGMWQPGMYQVWVGSYQADVNNNYRIKISGE